MSAVGQNAQQLQQDIQLELTTANQLLTMISKELQIIKNFTNPGGELEATIKHNTTLITTLANLQHIDLQKIPPFIRRHIALNAHENQNETNKENNATNPSDMDENH